MELLLAELQQEDDFEGRPEYWTHYLLLEIGEQIAGWMRQRGVTRAELARRLGKSRPYVTKLLSGRPNMTIDTLVRVARALDVVAQVRLEREEDAGRTVARAHRPILATQHGRKKRKSG